MFPDSFDLIVLGGGPAGTSGAFAAALFGKRVALVEAQPDLGGAGANTGTIPSKTLRESALVINGWRDRKLLGIDVSVKPTASLQDFTRHAGQVSEAERLRLSGRAETLRVERVTGRGEFVDPHTIRVKGPSGERLLRGEFVLIATGSTPSHPPEFPFDHPRVHDSDELLNIKELPRSLAVIGAGVIGAEYACMFAALGVEVHLIDGRDSLLSFLDAEVSEAITKGMTLGGIAFHWKERVQKCEPTGPESVKLTLSSGKTLDVTDVLVAAGRTSNTPALNLAAAGVTPGERGLLHVDAHYRTAVPHILAAGDVIGAPALAATGMEQARVAVGRAFNLFDKEAPTLLPVGIYTIPEASMVGETENSLREKKEEYIVGRALYKQSARGRIIGSELGFLKLLFRRSDQRLLGVHVVGEQATELVHVGMVAMLSGANLHFFNQACFNYPTLGDLYKTASYHALLTHLQRNK